jgi:polysaccharide export outer membrane protein
VPKPPYKLGPLDEVAVRFPAVPEYLKKDEFEDLLRTGKVISGNFTIEPEGTLNLGPLYGKVKVADLSVEQARKVVEDQLKKTTEEKLVQTGKVFLELTQFRGMQQVRGPHLVRPDGTVSLGIYGSVRLAGFTLDEAKVVLEDHLSQFIEKPEISIDIAGYNSSFYYLIFDGAGNGEQVMRIPVTGNETVLDAISQVSGLPAVAWKRNIWIARPTVEGEDMILPVAWREITKRGITETNYQLLPGDRLYVQAEPIITLDTYIGRVFAPIERVMGGVLFGTSTYRTLRFIGSRGAVGGGFGF